MNIAIDLSTFRSYQGTEVYAEHIVAQLIKTSTEHEFFIFKNKDMFLELEKIASTCKHVQIIPNNKKRKISSGLLLAFYEQCILPFRLWKRNVKVIFSPSPFISICARGEKIVVIHDAAYKKFKEFRNVLSEVYINASILFARHFSGCVITVSDFSKKELVDLYHFGTSAVHVLRGSAPVLPTPDKKILSELKIKFSIGNKYFLFIGSPRTRKNIERTLAAFKIFHQRHPEYQLVIVGNKESHFLDIQPWLAEFTKNVVIMTGFVSNEEKASLYANAQGLVFTSLYEGFGLPLLEAHSFGIPVLTSNCTSMPEVAGDGAIFVDPYSTADIVRGMEMLAFDESIRQKIICAGYQNIQRFSWSKSADALLKLLLKK